MKTNVLKLTAIMLILAGSFCSCNKDIIKEDNDTSLNNEPYETANVRLVKILNYSNSSASKLTGEVLYNYDEAGNLINESYFDEWNGTMIPVMCLEYEYSGNNKIKESVFNCSNGQVLSSYTEYLYEGCQLVKEKIYRGYDSSLLNSTTYEYDERGNLIRKRYASHHRIETSNEHKYVYDDQNRLILEETPEIGVSEYYHKYLKHIYDNSGKEVKLEYYNVNEELIRYAEISYNGASKLEKELYYDKNGTRTVKYQHFYDEWENLIETVINDECSKFKRKYNGKLLIEEIHYWWHEYGYFGTGQMPESGMSRYEYEEL